MLPAQIAQDRAKHAHDAAGAAHELERLLLSLFESLRRDEPPGDFVPAAIRGAKDRLNALAAVALGE